MTHYYDPATVDITVGGRKLMSLSPDGFIAKTTQQVHDSIKRQWTLYFAASAPRGWRTVEQHARRLRLLELALTKGRYWTRRYERDCQRGNKAARAAAKLLPRLLKRYRR